MEDPSNRRTAPAAGPFAWALASALAFALLDAAVDLEARSALSPSPLSTGVVLGVGVMTGALLFLAAWIVLAVLRRPLRLEPAAISAAAPIAVLAAGLPVWLGAWRRVEADLGAVPVAAGVGLVLAAAAAFGLSRLLRAFPHLHATQRSAALVAVAGPLLLFSLQAVSRSGLGGLVAVAAGAAVVLAALTRPALRSIPAAAPLGVLALLALVLGARSLDPTDRAPEDSGRTEGEPARHVLLVVVDTLRADHLSCLDDGAPRTPALDRFAEESVVFERTRSAAPWTFPSMSSVLSGLAPAVHLGLRPGVPLAVEVPTVAQGFSGDGWRTSAFVRNPALWRTTFLDRGFDEFHFYRELRPASAIAELVLRELLPEIYAPRVGADVQCEDAARWLLANRDRDTFTWLHLFDPHMAYEPPPGFQPKGDPPPRVGRRFADAARVRGGFFNPHGDEREWIRELYAGEVRAMDEAFGALVETLRAEGLWEDTLVVFTSDHGEEFWEHGLFEHGQALYDETVRVPLMIKPAGAGPRVRVDTDVCNESVAPTLYELAGIPYRAEALTSRTLMTRDAEGDARIAEDLERPLPIQGILYFEDRSAVVLEGHKYIRWEVTGDEELYDLAQDPGETDDVSSERTELLVRAREALRVHLERCEALRVEYGIEAVRGDVELDADTVRDLRALGYVK